MIRDCFSEYHPIVNFVYFVLMIVFSMIIIHPIALVFSLLCALLYAISTEGIKNVWFMLKYCLPMVVMTAFINPAFNHEGSTILLYFNNGNPLTLESIFYGFSAGIMLATILLWFVNFNRVMTSDKFIYLFGRILPALSLILSMSLRFVPKFKTQMNLVTEAQKSIGRDVSSGSLWNRTKIAVSIFSIMITWVLENAIETADSMKSRGYGLKGRTAFSNYQLSERDIYTLIWLLFCGMFLGAGTMVTAFGFRYYPTIRSTPFNRTTIFFYFIYLALGITPVVLNWKEERKWKTILSKM